MIGGSLTRYHTPTVQRGGQVMEDLIKVAGPLVVDSMGRMVQDVQGGMSAQDSLRRQGQALRKNLKRKAPAMVASVGTGAAKRKAKKVYKRVTQPMRRVRDILS